MFLQYSGWNEAYGESNPKRHKNDIIQIAEYRNEIRYQIYRAECIGCHTRGDDFGVPRHSWVARGEVEGYHVPF